MHFLDLSWNGLGKDGCQGFEVSLKENCTLKHLDISSNRIGTLGLDHLLRGLKANTGLTSIKVRQLIDDIVLLSILKLHVKAFKIPTKLVHYV